MGSGLQPITGHPIEAGHQQLGGTPCSGRWPHRFRLAHQGGRLSQGQLCTHRGQGLGVGLELLLEGSHPLEDFGGLHLESIAELAHHRLPLIEVRQHRRPSHGLDAADASGHPGLADDFEQADLSGIGHMGAATELHRHAGHIHHPHHIAVLLAKHRHGPGGLGLLDRQLLHL